MSRITPQIPIVSMTVSDTINDVGADACKRMSPGYRHRYSTAVVYTLNDGQKVDGTLRGVTKPKLMQAIADRHRHIADGWMFAELWNDPDIGNYWSVIMTMNLSALCPR